MYAINPELVSKIIFAAQLINVNNVNELYFKKIAFLEDLVLINSSFVT